MAEISKAVQTLIHKTCRAEARGDLAHCKSAVKEKLEGEIDKVCRLSFKENSLVDACHEKLFTTFWASLEELSKKLKEIPAEPLVATLKGLQGLVADGGTIHEGEATFIEWESRNYQRATVAVAEEKPTVQEEPIPPEAQCMTRPEWELFKKINDDRARFTDEYVRFNKSTKRAWPLEVDCDIVRVARKHSEDTALHCAQDRGKKDFTQCHVDSKGRHPWDRVRAVTDRFQAIAENIANGGMQYDFSNLTGIQDDPHGFMDYPPGEEHTHRANVLNPDLTHAGVGVYVYYYKDETGREWHKFFVTEDFGGFPKY